MKANGKGANVANLEPDSRAIPAAEAKESVTVATLVSQVRRQALADPWLRTRGSEHKLTRLADTAVCALWRDSTVKTFVAALALRQMREELGRREGLPNENRGSLPDR